MSLLSNILTNNQKNEYFLTIGLEEHHIHAAVGKISENTVTIVGTGESEFQGGENLTEAADIAISTAEKNISENILIEKAIFGIPVTFLEKGKIKSEYLSRIKKISTDLSLKTQGFIEYPVALAFYLETKEESPPTILLLSIARETITLSLIRVGKVENNISVSKTASITSDFENALSFYTTEVMPSRIMLFDETRNAPIDEYKEELLAFHWQKKSSFLHTPKVEILPSKLLLTALVETVGGTLIKELQMEEQEFPSQEKLSEVPPKAQSPQQRETFVADSPDEFGFTQQEITPQIEKSTNEDTSEDKDRKLFQTKPDTGSFFGKIKNSMATFTSLFPSVKLPILPFVVMSIMCIVLLGGGVLLAWSYPKVHVNLIVYPLTSSQQIDIALTADSSDRLPNSNTIVIQSITEEVKGDKSVSATGKTRVGEKSKGSVSLYNKTLTTKNFPTGTNLILGTLKFLLDEDITVASASDTGEGLTFGKTNAKVTAAEIGPEGNIDSGRTFTMKDFPDTSYYAKNTEKFSGGTSRDITSVSKEDQEKLQSTLTEEMTSRAKQFLLQKVPAGHKLLDRSMQPSVVSKKFNKEIGDETKEISLSLTLEVNGSIFKQSDLLELTNAQLGNPPQGYMADTQRTTIQFQDIQTDKKNNTTAKAIVTAFYLPIIKEDEIKSEITGKSFQETEKILRGHEFIGGIEIIDEKPIFFLSQKLPLNKSGIAIQIVSH